MIDSIYHSNRHLRYRSPHSVLLCVLRVGGWRLSVGERHGSLDTFKTVLRLRGYNIGIEDISIFHVTHAVRHSIETGDDNICVVVLPPEPRGQKDVFASAVRAEDGTLLTGYIEEEIERGVDARLASIELVNKWFLFLAWDARAHFNVH